MSHGHQTIVCQCGQVLASCRCFTPEKPRVISQAPCTHGLDARLERLCEVMHDAYEQAAVGAGWETQQASRKPWGDVPEPNKQTMRVAVAALLKELES